MWQAISGRPCPAPGLVDGLQLSAPQPGVAQRPLARADGELVYAVHAPRVLGVQVAAQPQGPRGSISSWAEKGMAAAPAATAGVAAALIRTRSGFARTAGPRPRSRTRRVCGETTTTGILLTNSEDAVSGPAHVQVLDGRADARGERVEHPRLPLRQVHHPAPALEQGLTHAIPFPAQLTPAQQSAAGAW